MEANQGSNLSLGIGIKMQKIKELKDATESERKDLKPP
jgi:hypothetical protein